ncbi:Hsp20/alpha crystallin family protein [Pikeienuella piscinae]|uniref:Hsp20/alpha crystallin family protein n=1 Tax=Pikeienuella piscinae TaxID=2748098 RepID=A0A7L5BT41_9RHOB|nr:Hsp20/alpha crystallin family protein [Pikeienuella piscinae]QIE54392.1 Hsp20/alpha crystallin family protein [Pikeienuella piscinae]
MRTSSDITLYAPADWWRISDAPAPFYRRVAAHDPFRVVQERFNRLLDEFLPPSPSGREARWTNAVRPAMTVTESDESIVVRASLPGLRERDVEVQLDDRGLTIRAERSAFSVDRGRRFAMGVHGSFERRIPLPAGVDPDLAEAEFRDGALTVTLPRTRVMRLREKGGALKERLRSWWSRLRGKDASRQS